MKIELIPNLSLIPSERSVKECFYQLLETCQSIMGCTGFWTLSINDAFLRKNNIGTSPLLNALKRPQSFFCTDITYPTDIDIIAQYVEAGGAEVYIHKFRENPETYTKNTGLLHSKILLFNINEDDAEIWIGSHNFTNAALGGGNLEASVSIQCKKTDDIYVSIYKYLENIKNYFCIKFDIGKVDIYKKLQTRDAQKDLEDIGLENVVILFGESMDNLKDEGIIQFLSIEGSYKKFNEIDKKIYIYAYDSNTNTFFLYECAIEQAGKLDANRKKLRLEFKENRRFAYIGLFDIAKLNKSTKITDAILDTSIYFVNIKIEKIINYFKICEKPDKK